MKKLYSLATIVCLTSNMAFAAANPDLEPTFSSDVANYVPGGVVEITVNLNHNNVEVAGASFLLEVPDGWGEDGVEWISGMEPDEGPNLNPFENEIDALWISFAQDLEDLPESQEDLVISISVPVDYRDTAHINLTATWGDAANVPSEDNPLVIEPPLPPQFSNPDPGEDYLETADPAQIENRVTAGDSITFAVDIEPAEGAELEATAFWVSPGVFFDGIGRWEMIDEDQWLTRRGAGEDEEVIFFSDDRETLTPVGDNTFNWTSIAGNQPGRRTFTWELPEDLVNKGTPEDDRVFVAGIGARQDNGAEKGNDWAVYVEPVNQPPQITDPAEDQVIESVSEGDEFEFSVTAFDPDEQDTLSYSWYYFDPYTDEWEEIDDGSEEDTFAGTIPYDTVMHPDKYIENARVRVVVTDDDPDNPLSAERVWTIEAIYDTNRPPNQPETVEVTPAGPVKTDQDLTVEVTHGGDPDDHGEYVEPLLYSYVWTDDNEEVVREVGPMSETTDTLPADLTEKDRAYTCAVTVEDDPYGDGTGSLSADPMASNAVEVTNTPPTVEDISVFIRKDAGIEPEVNIELQGRDADGDPLTFWITTLPEKGDLSYEEAGVITAVPYELPNNNVTYTVKPEYEDEEFFGEDADTFEYKANDGVEDSETGAVIVTYRENQPPEVISLEPGEIVGDPTMPQTGDNVEIDEGDTASFAVEMTDEFDPSGLGEMEEVRWYVNGELMKTTPAGQSDGGEVSLSESEAEESISDTFDFVTDYDTISNDETGHRPPQKDFEITAVGEDNQQATNEVVWTVTVNDVDRDAPAPEQVSINPEEPLTADDLVAMVDPDDQPADPDGDEIVGYRYLWELDADDGQQHEDQTLDSQHTTKGQTWQVTVWPLTNPYDAEEPIVSPNARTASITIGNTPPLAIGQSVTVEENDTIEINLEGQDPDVDDGIDTLIFDLVEGPSDGTLVFNADGTATYTAHPEDYDGPAPREDSFTFTVDDGDDVSEPATVEITINWINQPPVAHDSSAYSEANVEDDDGNFAEIDRLSASDREDDAAGIELTYTIASLPEEGDLVDQEGDSLSVGDEVIEQMQPLRYFPDIDFRGSDEFTFQATDSDGAVADEPGRVRITVGTPLWYPFFDWDEMEGHDDGWYNVQIWDETEEDASLVLETNVNGLEMTPRQYFRAGSEGLLPGVYSTRYRVWNPRTNRYGEDWMGTNSPQLIVDYGKAELPETSIPVEVNNEERKFELEFIAPNARGYRLELTGPRGFRRTFNNVYRPDEETGVIPLNQPTVIKVTLPVAGVYQWRVSGYNPLDDALAGDAEYQVLWRQGDEFEVDEGETPDFEDRAPQGLEPPHGDLIALPEGQGNVTLTLQWDPVPGAAGYRIYLASSATGVIRNFQDVGGNTSFRVPVGKGSYTWMVIARNTDGEYGSWTDVHSFEVASDMAAPVITEVLEISEIELQFGLAEGAAELHQVQFHHHDGSRWREYGPVPVDGANRVVIDDANFQAGDYVQIRGFAEDGTTSEYKILEIKLLLDGKPE